MTKVNIKLISKKEVATDTMTFHFYKPAGFTFKPGQFAEETSDLVIEAIPEVLEMGDEVSARVAVCIKDEYLDKGKMGKANGKGVYTYPNPAYGKSRFLKGRILKRTAIAVLITSVILHSLEVV